MKFVKPNEPWQRLVIGGLSIACLLSAALLVLFNPGTGAGLMGMLVRIGLVLGTIWLAMPQLLKLRPMQSATVWAVVICLLLVAARSPNLFRVAMVLMGIGLAVHFFLKSASWLVDPSSVSPKDGKSKYK